MSRYFYVPILLFPLIPLSPLIGSWAWPSGHENDRYIILLENFREAVLHGFLYPRWLPNLFGGYGYPTFCFYQPGFFYLALPFSFLLGYPAATLQLTLYAVFLGGAAGAYKLCSELADRSTGLLGAVVFLFTPYLYANLYVRGDLSELTAMLLCPWPLFFLVRLKKQVERRQHSAGVLIGLGLTLALIIVTHPATALLFFPIVCLISLYVGWYTPSRFAFYGRIALALCFALALSSPYWWTVFQMRQYVQLDWAFQGYFQAAKHTVHLPQLFDRAWNFGGSVVDSPRDGMSFQLGAMHFILATAGAYLCRGRKMFQAVYVLYIALILLMTPLAEKLWAGVELLRMIQFPWRILSVIAVLQLVCVAGLVKLTRYNLVKTRAPFWLFLLLAVFVLWHGNQFAKGDSLDLEEELRHWEQQERFTGFINLSFANEFLPKAVPVKARIEPRPPGDPVLKLAGPGELKPLENSSDYRIRWEIQNQVPSRLRIEQIYFPGWKVLLNGQVVAPRELEENLNQNGLMTIVLMNSGRYLLEAHYEGPPGWRLRALIAVVALIAGGGFWWWERKTYS